jgi:malonate-semialdehyde dehydrogenase (acetylating)/methylmalonate-semialdehyde dehydrogenase
MDRLQNFIGGEWRPSSASEALKVINPASAAVIAEVPLSPATDVNAAVEVAERAFVQWRRTPVVERIQPLFKLKALLEQHRDELSLAITDECGKTLGESKAEILRAVENVETACAMPMMIQGTNCEDIAHGIDEHMIRQPLGVTAAIVPFNFPGMIPFWFMPYAVAAGNCFLLKPSERVPITSQKIFSLIEAAGFPPASFSS